MTRLRIIPYAAAAYWVLTGVCTGASIQVLAVGSFNIATEPGLVNMKDGLTNPANFGPGGIIGRSVAFSTPVTSVAVLSAAELVGVDVVVLTEGADAAAGALLGNFVQNGGGLVVMTGDLSQLSAAFGFTFGGFIGDEGPASVSDAASPLVNGPFGSLSVGTPNQVGFHGVMSALGGSGAGALTVPTGDFFGASFTHGTGKAALFGDEEMFTNGGKSFVGSTFWTATSQTIFLDSFAFVTPPAASTGVPEPAGTALLGLLCVGTRLMFQARRRGANVLAQRGPAERE